MAARGGLILAAVAAVAAVVAGRKKTSGGGGLKATPAYPEDDEDTTFEPAETLPPPAPFPKDWHGQLMRGMQAAVDRCFEELGIVNDVEIRICALGNLFPEAPWPPPKNAHQWQRNVWHNKDLINYIRSKYPPIS